MYRELGSFLKEVAEDKSMFKDGELPTAAIVSVAVDLWANADPSIFTSFRNHFGDALALTGILFGFVLTAVTLYITSLVAWAKTDNRKSVAKKLVRWHIWTMICLLALIGLIIVTWALDSHFAVPADIRGGLYFPLLFCGAYSLAQILNHALTLKWAFSKMLAE